MIVNIRGTSGSGKSYIVRQIMDDYPSVQRHYEPNRRQPLYYLCSGKGRTLAVLGHYETPCGGCDTINKQAYIYELVRGFHASGHHVLYEGLLCSEESARAIALVREELPLRVIHLTTPLDTCLTRIGERRKARGDDRPLNPRNTTNRVRVIQRAVQKIEAAGGSVWTHDGATALPIIRGWLCET